jgi:hypothetical protein
LYKNLVYIIYLPSPIELVHHGHMMGASWDAAYPHHLPNQALQFTISGQYSIYARDLCVGSITMLPPPPKQNYVFLPLSENSKTKILPLKQLLPLFEPFLHLFTILTSIFSYFFLNLSFLLLFL